MFSCPKCPDHRTLYGYSPALCPKHAHRIVRARPRTPTERRIREKLLRRQRPS